MRRTMFVVLAAVVVILAGAWFVLQEAPAAPTPSAPPTQAALHQRSLEQIAEKFGDLQLASLLAEQADAPSGIYLRPRRSFTLLRPDGAGGVQEQQLPALPDSGYHAAEVDSGTHRIWHVRPYNGYLRADPEIPTTPVRRP